MKFSEGFISFLFTTWLGVIQAVYTSLFHIYSTITQKYQLENWILKLQKLQLIKSAFEAEGKVTQETYCQNPKHSHILQSHSIPFEFSLYGAIQHKSMSVSFSVDRHHKLNPNLFQNTKTQFCKSFSVSLMLSIPPRLLQTLHQSGLQYLSLVTSNVLHTNWVFFWSSPDSRKRRNK